MSGLSPHTPGSPRQRYLPFAELALTGLTVATVLSFRRLFDGLGFLPPMLAVGLYAHGATLVARRRGWSVPVAAVVSIPLGALLCVWLIFPESTSGGVPSGHTLTAVDNALWDAWQSFSSVLAPAPPLPGFVLASCIALYFAVFLADWAAFRLWSAFEAVVPATTLFIFGALLGVAYKIEATTLFLAALLVFLLLHNAAHQETSTGWLVGEPLDQMTPGLRPTRRAMPLQAGLVLVAVAVLSGVILGGQLPGAGEPAMVPWRTPPQGSGSRSEVSPLVNIGHRLLEQQDTELFTVRADTPSYWRLTALDTFDGQIWKSSADFLEAVGELDGKDPDTQQKQIDQRFTISKLDMPWTPAAFRPVDLVESSTRLGFNKDSSTLIVEDGPTSPGDRYDVISKVAQHDPEGLRSVSADDLHGDDLKPYLALPDDFSELARSEARTIAGDGRSTPYDLALKLQNYFRDPSRFSYEVQADGGHSESAIDSFLTHRKGFCEQFAGTYAAMARVLGLPSRVAVGFTQGIRDTADSSLYRVTGRQTHAWPEVYLGSHGWVPFEPTPGRGAPNAEAWTRVPPDQDDGTRQVPDTAAVGSTPSAPTGTISVAPGPATPTTIEPLAESTTTVPVEQDLDVPAEPRPWWLTAVVVGLVIIAGLVAAALAVGALAGAYLGVLTMLKQRRRRDRRARATTPTQRVRVAWLECLEALAVIDLTPRRAESREEFAMRTAAALGDLSPEVRQLAELLDHGEYATDELGEHEVALADTLAGDLIAGAMRRATPLQAWRDRLDPRTLIGDGYEREPQRTVSM